MFLFFSFGLFFLALAHFLIERFHFLLGLYELFVYKNIVEFFAENTLTLLFPYYLCVHMSVFGYALDVDMYTCMFG